MAIDKAHAKLVLEMVPTILPIHDPEDLEKMSSFMPGIPWGKVAYALSVDCWQAILRHPEGFDVFEEYLEFFQQCIDFAKGERDELPDVIEADEDLAQAMKNRLAIIRKEVSKLA